LYKKFSIPTNQPIVSYVGRLDAEKHLPVLLRAFERVQSVVPNAHLVIVGDGTERLALINLAHEAGLDESVTFTGRVSDEELEQLHRIGTVFCMPSPAELQSIATLEAMASGQPVVAVDAGALKELCQDQRNGYLCEQDDDVVIADGLLAIISDPSLREKMSKESLTIATTHDLQTTLARFEEIYSGLVNR
jgi:glycosyltransferase involved in cell wall biosynthesis